MNILELFSGTGSIGKAGEELGHKVYSIDISDKYHKPTWKGDILKWDYKQFPKGHFDMIWASPPCCAFSSILNICKNKEEREAYERKHGLPFLLQTRKILDWYEPKYWGIENPYSSRMKDYIDDLPQVRVCYCMYGYTYKKPTRIWTNIPFEPKYCLPSNGCANSKKHLNTIAMTRTNTSGENQEKYIKKKGYHIECKDKGQRYSIPHSLCMDIVGACEFP